MSKLIIYTDGGSRGNPGPAAIGVVIGEGAAAKKYSETIGMATNNEAEYKAIIFALKKTKALLGKEKIKNTEIEVRMDSELAAKQLNGEYKVMDEKIKMFWMNIWNLRIDFGKIIFKHIPREKNKEADQLLNKALDDDTRKRGLF